MLPALHLRVLLISSLPLLLSAVVVAPAPADVKLPAIESDNMLLSDREAAIFGRAESGEEIKVSFRGASEKTVADRDGKWRVTFKGLKRGDTGDISVSGKNEVLIKNVLVGQVWLCSGQSNMEFPLKLVRHGKEEMEHPVADELRVFKIEHATSDTPVADVRGKWCISQSASIADFSAVGYFFGKELHDRLKTPIGLVESSWGGTTCQAWTSSDGLKSNVRTKERYWKTAPQAYKELHETEASYKKAMEKWQADKARDQAAKQPKAPWALVCPGTQTVLYNGMIDPITGYTFNGVIWYQGEANASPADEAIFYRFLFPTMIKDWRQKFASPELPFIYVQLPNFDDAGSFWALVRESQLLTLSLPNTGMAVTIDIGEGKELHPRNKKDVAMRLAPIALGMVYHLDVPYLSPLFDKLTIKDKSAVVSFKNCDSGLTTKDGRALEGFTICGEDKKFYDARATISGNTVIVECDQVKSPVAVRYAFGADPKNSLYSKDGLPASPFRTDIPPADRADSTD